MMLCHLYHFYIVYFEGCRTSSHAFALKAHIIATLCMCNAQVHPKSVAIFSENECMMEFEEGTHRRHSTLVKTLYSWLCL